MPYAAIPEGKVGRYTPKEGENKFDGMCVSPVKGHTVIVLKGKVDKKESITLIHYNQFTATHTLNMERARFDDKKSLQVIVYFNHREANPHLVEVVRVRLQESHIEHELRSFPEKEKGILATIEGTKTFNADQKGEYEIVFHPENALIRKHFKVNQVMRLLEGLLKVGVLHQDGKITNVPGDSKYMLYEGDIYRHINELADQLVERLNQTEVVFDGDFCEIDEDDTALYPFAQEVISDIPKDAAQSEHLLEQELQKALNKKGATSVPRSKCDLSRRISSAAKIILSSKLLE